MNLLAIDAGNSRVKWGLHDGSTWLERGVAATSDGAAIAHAFAAVPAADRIVAANVAGEEAAHRIALAIERFGVEPHWVVSRDEQCGVRSSYAQPARLGPDRWAALIAARNLYEGPCVVVNAGTTMTVDALTAEGVFLGGYIVPGYNVMRQALSRNTALLKLQEGSFSFFPDNTGDAISSGALNALAGAVDRMAEYMLDTGEGEAVIVLSGGDAPLLTGVLSGRVEVRDNLVLEGLLCIGVNDV